MPKPTINWLNDRETSNYTAEAMEQSTSEDRGKGCEERSLAFAGVHGQDQRILQTFLSTHFSTALVIKIQQQNSCLITVQLRLTQPCIPPGSLNRVPASAQSAGDKAGKSPLLGDM